MARPKAILFVGPPGSGKGTQAALLVSHFEGYKHFDAGRAIENVVHDPNRQDDPIVRSEKERFDSGLLTTPGFAIKIICEGIERIARSGFGFVSSGAPRTREDAETMIPLLQQIYGEGSILVFHIIVKKETSLLRNTRRRVCKDCGRSLQWSSDNEQTAFCPACGGELATRSLDKEDIIEIRWREYEHLTESILPFFVALGIPIVDINGEQEPEGVAADIRAVLEKSV